MAIIDTINVRREVKRLKQEFGQLCSEGKASPEIRLVMNSLLIVVELILSILLKKITLKYSTNSSLPPSQIHKDETTLSNSANKGKSKKSYGELVSNTRSKETVTNVLMGTAGFQAICKPMANLDVNPFLAIQIFFAGKNTEVE